MGPRKRIGILTGGGDCPGLNAVIRAVVKHGVVDHGLEIIGIKDSFNGLFRHPYEIQPLGRDAVSGILTKGGTILGTTNRGDPFAFPTPGPDGTVSSMDRSDELIEALRILEIDGLVVVGGDGTLRIAQRLIDKGLCIVGVPKTIDNDIGATEVTFGFNTAVEIATEAIDRLHSTAESHDRVMVVEVMGRDCGWIAVHAGISGGADVILIPEIPYNIRRICDTIRRRQASGRSFSILVVAEGAFEDGQTPSYIDPAPSSGGMARLGGAGHRVADLIQQVTHLETRVTVLGHLIRGGTPSSYDRLLATRFGKHAVDLIARDGWGQMVALSAGAIVSVPIAEGVRTLKRVDPDGDLIATGRATGVSFG